MVTIIIENNRTQGKEKLPDIHIFIILKSFVCFLYKKCLFLIKDGAIE